MACGYLSLLTRDRTCDLCIGSTESPSLDHQVSPTLAILKVSCFPLFQSGGGGFKVAMSRLIAMLMSVFAHPCPCPAL